MFDIVFAQLGVIARTRNNFVEIAAVEERYLIIIHVKNEESKKQPFRISLLVIICCWEIVKKEEISSYLIYNLLSLGKMAEEAEPFSCRLFEYELAVKYLKI